MSTSSSRGEDPEKEFRDAGVELVDLDGEPDPPRRRRNPYLDWRTYVGAGVVVGLCGGAMALFSNAGRSSGDDDQFRARVACEQAVEGLLRAPATAQFSNQVTVPTETGYRATGAVDAQNAFGAMLRSSYRCDVVAGRVVDVQVD